MVDDDEVLLRSIVRGLRARLGCVVVAAADVQSATLCLEEPFDLVITDVHLPDGSGVDVAKVAAESRPAPPVIAITGMAGVQEGLGLGHFGVSKVLEKPFALGELFDAIGDFSLPSVQNLDAVTTRIVGKESLPNILDRVRRVMVGEALARTQQNKAQAAGVLGISRQHLQKILERGKA